MNTSIHLSLFTLSRFSAVETCTLRKKIEENNYKNVMGTPNICTYMEKLCGKKNSLYTLFSQISQCSHNEHCNTLQQHVQVGSRIIFSCFYHKVRPQKCTYKILLCAYFIHISRFSLNIVNAFITLWCLLEKVTRHTPQNIFQGSCVHLTTPKSLCIRRKNGVFFQGCM